MMYNSAVVFDESKEENRARYFRCVKPSLFAAVSTDPEPFPLSYLAKSWNYERAWREMEMRPSVLHMTTLSHRLLVVFVRGDELVISGYHSYLDATERKVSERHAHAVVETTFSRFFSVQEKIVTFLTEEYYVNGFYLTTTAGFAQLKRYINAWRKVINWRGWAMLPPVAVPVSPLYQELDRAGLYNDSEGRFTPPRRLTYNHFVTLCECRHLSRYAPDEPLRHAHADDVILRSTDFKRYARPTVVSRGPLTSGAQHAFSELFVLKVYATAEEAHDSHFLTHRDLSAGEPEHAFQVRLEPFEGPEITLTRLFEGQRDLFRTSRAGAMELRDRLVVDLDDELQGSGTPFPVMWCYPSRVLHSNGVVYVPTTFGKVPLCTFFNLPMLAELLTSFGHYPPGTRVPIQFVHADRADPRWYVYQYDEAADALELLYSKHLPHADHLYEKLYAERLQQTPVLHNGRLDFPVRDDSDYPQHPQHQHHQSLLDHRDHADDSWLEAADFFMR